MLKQITLAKGDKIEERMMPLGSELKKTKTLLANQIADRSQIFNKTAVL